MSDVERVRLEASSKCQLKCPLCPTATGENRAGIIGWGVLKLKDFRQFLDRNPKVKEIELSNFGEIFLNPDLIEILALAANRGVVLSARNGVNLNHASEAALEAVVKYRMFEMTVSIDGASDESYAKYRQRGSFTRVLRNLDRLIAFKAQYRSELPRLYWQFVPFGHNEHELARAKAMALERGMVFEAKTSWSPSWSAANSPAEESNSASWRRQWNALSRWYRDNHTTEKHCRQLWTQPQINWNGDMLGCCSNRWGTFGNVFTTRLSDIMTSERYQYAQAMVKGKQPPRADIPCFHCHVYRFKIFPRVSSKFLLRGSPGVARYSMKIALDIYRKLQKYLCAIPQGQG